MIDHDLFLYIGLILAALGWFELIRALQTDLKNSWKFLLAVVIILVLSIVCLWMDHPAIEIY